MKSIKVGICGREVSPDRRVGREECDEARRELPGAPEPVYCEGEYYHDMSHGFNEALRTSPPGVMEKC
jgi:hypothetical protein